MGALDESFSNNVWVKVQVPLSSTAPSLTKGARVRQVSRELLPPLHSTCFLYSNYAQKLTYSTWGYINGERLSKVVITGMESGEEMAQTESEYALTCTLQNVN